MTEFFIKAIQLDPTDYDPNQIIVVSDPRIPQGPDKRSLRITAGDIPAQIKQWNITPTTTVTGGDLEYVDNANAIINPDGSFHADVSVTGVAGGLYQYTAAAVKTNIQMSGLTNNTNTMYGLTITQQVVSGGYMINGPFLAPATWTPQQVIDTIVELLITGSVTTQDSFILGFSLQLGFGAVAGNQILAKLPNQNVENLDSALQLPELNGVDASMYLLVGGGSDGYITLGGAVVSASGTVYDLFGGIGIGVDGDIPADTTLFYYTLQLDLGTGFGELTCKPTLINNIPSGAMAVNNTTYGGLVTPTHYDTDWAQLFPGGFTPVQTVTVTQAPYPPSAIVGAVLETYVDVGYVGYPTPYGISTQPLETVQITSLTPGSESHTRLLRGNALNDVWDAVSTLQNTVGTIQTDLTTVTNELSSAALENSEIVVYVRSFLYGLDPLTGPMVFDTFTLAYNYLITQPAFIHKRIVIDDRGSTASPVRVIVPAVQGFQYLLLENLITVSTYIAYNGYPYDNPQPSSEPKTVLKILVDGFLLDRYSGGLAPVSDFFPYLMNLVGTGINLENTSYNLRIGEDCAVWIAVGAVQAVGGGNVVVGDRSVLFWDVTTSTTVITQPIAFYVGDHAAITITGNTTGSTTGTGKALSIYNHITSSVTLLGDIATSVDYYPLDPVINGRFAYDGYTIIRDVSDFGNMIQSGYVDLQPGKYWIVGVVDLGSMFIRPPGWGRAVIVGMPGSVLLSTNYVIVPDPYIGTNLHIVNMDLVSTGDGTTALTATGVVYLRNVRLYADTPLILNNSQSVDEISADIDGLGLYGPLVANSLNFDSTPPVAATSYINSTAIMVKNVKGVVNGTPLITFGFKSTGVAAYAPPVVIDGVDVTHTQPLVAAVSTFAFYNNPIPAQTQRPNNSVHVNNIRTHGAQPPLWSYNNVATDVSEYPVFVANSNDAGSAVVFGSATCNNQTGGSNLPFTPSWSVANELRFLRSDTAVSMTCLATTRRRYLVRLDGYIASSVSAAGVTLLLRAFIGASQPNVSQVINITTTPKPFTIAMFVSLRLNDVVALNLDSVTNGYNVLLTNLNMVITPV